MRMRPVSSAILGGLVAGALDITYAMIYWKALHKVDPIRIGQGIASHVVGTGAFEGGWPVASLGFGLHFAIAIVMALTYWTLCTLFEFVGKRPLLFAPLYGVVLYVVMVYGVLPITDPKHGPWPDLPQLDLKFASAMFAHIVLVAIPIALFIRPRPKR